MSFYILCKLFLSFFIAYILQMVYNTYNLTKFGVSMQYKCCVPCLLGLEGPIADELKRLGIDNVNNENGRVYFTGNESAVALTNISLRIGERVLIEVGRFEARSFEELFEKVKSLPWEAFLPKDAAFPVKGYCLNSQLMSVPDCQKIIKKAIVERLKTRYHLNWFEETGPVHQIQFSVMKDDISLCIDTSGDGLHKRGYRPAHTAAPLKETMAAALVTLSRCRGKEDFCDPFCGSGTIPVEAALIARNIAPGLRRSSRQRNGRSAIKKPGLMPEKKPVQGNITEIIPLSAQTLILLRSGSLKKMHNVPVFRISSVLR